MSKDKLHQNLGPVIERRAIEASLTLAKTVLEAVVTPVTESAKDVFKSKGIKDKSLLAKEAQFFRTTSFKNDGIISGLNQFSALLQEQIIAVEAIVDRELPKTMTRESLTYSQFAVIRFAGVVEFCSSYMNDFIRYALTLETVALSGQKLSDALSKGFINSVERGWEDFYNSASLLDRPAAEVVRMLEETPDLIMSLADHSSAIATHSSKLVPMRSGFIATQFNPIYRIRMALSEMSAKRYQKADESKRMYELQLEYLEQARSGEVDPLVEKRIEELNMMIDDINHDMLRMERRYE